MKNVRITKYIGLDDQIWFVVRKMNDSILVSGASAELIHTTDYDRAIAVLTQYLDPTSPD